MPGRRITIEFLGDPSDFNRAVDSVDKKASGLSGKLKSVGKAAGAGFAIVGAVGAKVAIDAVGAASDLNETLNKSNTIFGKNAGAMEAWGDTAWKSAGLSKQAALEAAAGFGDMFSQIGFAGDQSAKMSRDVVQLSADLGSFNNLETADVADRMSAAFRGEYDSLQALIPNINAARVEKEALAATGKKTAASLTAQEKAAAVLAIVNRDGARAQGDFAKTSGGLANQQKILKAQLENVQASIGQKLLPVAVKLMTFFNDKALPAIQAFGGYLERVLPPVFDRVRSVIDKFSGDGSGKLAAFVEQVKAVFRDGVAIVTKLWEMFGENILGFLVGWVKSMVKIFSGVWDVFRGIFKTFSSLLKGDWKGVWKGLQLIFRGFGKIFIGLVQNVWNTVKFAFKNAGVVLKAIFGNIWDGIRNVARNGAQWLVDQVRSIPGRLLSLGRSFLNAGKDLIGKFLEGIGKVGSFVGGFASQIWDAVKGAINAGIDNLNNLLEFEIDIPGPNIHVNAPDIPHLAKGGVVKARPGGTLALLGEAGHDEAVVPLSGPHAPRGRTLSDDGNERPILVQLVLDGKVLEQALIRRTRQTQRPLQVKTL